jgi:serine/threonine-protein kinase
MRTLGGRYRLEEEIGSGGMGAVWRGHDQVLDRAVAVKLLSGKHADAQTFERARNEARCAARLSHPNVANVYDFGTSLRGGRGEAYLVMELVDGPRLADELQRGPLDWRYAARISAEVCAGLAAAHGSQIVHRDIKPGNVVLTPAGAKILDFGIAARVGQPDRPLGNTVLGTAAYIAPERLQGRPVTPANDMYAVGVLLYQSITGELPWPARTDEELMTSHREITAAPLPPLDADGEDVAQVCADCLAKGPARRPTAVAAALLLATAVDVPVYLPPVVSPPSHPTVEDPLHAPTAAYAS